QRTCGAISPHAITPAGCFLRPHTRQLPCPPALRLQWQPGLSYRCSEQPGCRGEQEREPRGPDGRLWPRAVPDRLFQPVVDSGADCPADLVPTGMTEVMATDLEIEARSRDIGLSPSLRTSP